MSGARRRGPTSTGPGHQFGGHWTNTKLALLERYLSAYTTALKNQPFETEYIDAFAGTGYRTLHEAGDADLLFPDLADPLPQGLLAGSATVALRAEPTFDKYIFIEKSAERCAQLESLRIEFSHRAADIRIENREANAAILDLCRRDWRQRRAVMFLDPYGMQVEWSTLEAIAGTRAIDLWLLFPLGIGTNRLLTKSGRIPDGWRRRLDKFFGPTPWFEEFYAFEEVRSLFGVEQRLRKKATYGSITRYFNDRLRTIFAGTVDEPRMLSNSQGCPLYLLCFAVGNERGKDIALRIASHVLKMAD